MENPMEKIYIFRATPILGNLMKPPSPHVGSHKRPTSSGTSVKSSFFGTDQGGDQCLPLDSPHWSCGKGQRKSIIFGCFWGYDLQVVDPKCLTHSNTLSLLNAENAGSPRLPNAPHSSHSPAIARTWVSSMMGRKIFTQHVMFSMTESRFRTTWPPREWSLERCRTNFAQKSEWEKNLT